LQEAKLLGIWMSLACHFGSLTCLTAHFFHPSAVDCIVCLGLSMTNAGWLGHDCVHGVDDFFPQKDAKFCSHGGRLDWIPFLGGPTSTYLHYALSKYSIPHELLLVYTTALYLLPLHKATTANEMGVDEDIATDPFLYPNGHRPAPEK
jgi:hypothetical protein